MATLAEIKRFIEGTDLVAEVQQDVNNIESTSFNTVLQGWTDLSQELETNPEYADLLSDPYSMTKGYIQTVENDAENYMQGINLQIERPNWNPNSGDSQYIPLYSGSAYIDSTGDINETENGVATLWGAVTGQYTGTTLVNDMDDAYFDNPGGPGPGLSTNWSQGNLNYMCQWDGNPNDNGEYCVAQGSLSNWAPYIVITGGDPSQLNQDAFF